MIHVGALANLAVQKFRAGTISLWQGEGKRLVLGGVWHRALAVLHLKRGLPRGPATATHPHSLGTNGEVPAITTGIPHQHCHVPVPSRNPEQL